MCCCWSTHLVFTCLSTIIVFSAFHLCVMPLFIDFSCKWIFLWVDKWFSMSTRAKLCHLTIQVNCGGFSSITCVLILYKNLNYCPWTYFGNLSGDGSADYFSNVIGVYECWCFSFMVSSLKKYVLYKDKVYITCELSLAIAILCGSNWRSWSPIVRSMSWMKSRLICFFFFR